MGPDEAAAQRSRNMAAVKRRNTQPELLLRSALHRNGLRFRVDFPLRLEGRIVRPDIAFTRAKVAVFVDGCFWHMCPIHGSMPATNAQFWKQKLESNAARDAQQTRLLCDAGWLVMRVWEHESPTEAVGKIGLAVDARRRTNVV